VKYILDTNVWSRYLRDRGEDRSLRQRVDACLSDCQLSAVVLMELEYGAEKHPEIPVFRHRVEYLRARVPRIICFDEDAAAVAGWLRAHLANLKPNAQPIGSYDVLLAAQAISTKTTLVSANTSEFSRIPRLRLENWQG
jgi:tRNA(fMet)-specific endonuclease VapC